MLTIVHAQVYTRLKQVGICLSYNTTLNLMDDIGKLHTAPLQQWISRNLPIKLWGDNVDKKRGTRDKRSDRQGELLHMYSIVARLSRTPSTTFSHSGSVANLLTLDPGSFLPSSDDVETIRVHLVPIISRVLTQYIRGLTRFHKIVPKHISIATQMRWHCSPKLLFLTSS